MCFSIINVISEFENRIKNLISIKCFFIYCFEVILWDQKGLQMYEIIILPLSKKRKDNNIGVHFVILWSLHGKFFAMDLEVKKLIYMYIFIYGCNEMSNIENNKINITYKSLKWPWVFRKTGKNLQL